MTPKATQILLGVVEPALKVIGMWSPAAENLVLGTAAHESEGFRFRRQEGFGPALGLWQIEPATFRSIFEDFLAFREPLRQKVVSLATGDPRDVEQLINNDLYSAALCRIKYYWAPDPLPQDPEDVFSMGALYKKVYNASGKGTAGEFVADYRRYVTGAA